MDLLKQMAAGGAMQANNSSKGEKLTSELGISKEHSTEMEDISKYMEKHRIPELFNEILTRLLDERPQGAKEHIIDYLKSAELNDHSEDPHCQRNH